MSLEMTPHILDRVEFRRVSRQTFQDDALAGGGDVVLDQQTAMNRRPIPQDQNFAGDMPLEVPEKLDDLKAFDTAVMNLKIEPPERQPANDGKTFPVESLVQDRRLPAGGPGANSRRARAQSTFIYKDDGSPLSAGFFLKRAIRHAASGGWPWGRAPAPGAPVSGN